MTSVIQPPTLLQNVLFCLFLLSSVVQKVCVCTMDFVSAAKTHMWPLAKKLYHSWISTMTSSIEISWKSAQTNHSKSAKHVVQGRPTSQRPRATFLTVLPQRATSYTWAHMNITPSLPHSPTCLCSARFIVNITHRYDNDGNLQGIYCYARYLVGLLVIT